jgi:hypothetical protein
MAQRGLGHFELCGGAREAAFACDRNERCELIEVSALH